MMTKYWKSIEEWNNPAEFSKQEMKLEAEAKQAVMDKAAGSSRRDFLKTLGFSVAAASVVAGCERPVEKAIPYLVKPEEVTPGVANYYASTFFESNEYCSVLVKVRDGRPIKIEGNDLSAISQQGTTARVQASVLNLYDDARFKSPQKDGTPVSWAEADEAIIAKLKDLAARDKKVVVLSSTIISPSSKKVIEKFIASYKNVQWLQYDAISMSGMLKANQQSFGRAVLPDYRFEKAKVIVSFGADFLGTWLSPVEYAKAYSAGRKVLKKGDDMNRHYQFEAGMSLTGSNADVRFPIKPSEEKNILVALYNHLLKAKNMPAEKVNCAVDLSGLVQDLLENQGKSLVVSGSNDEQTQLVVNAINHLLENYGSTISLANSLQTYQGMDDEFEAFMKELVEGNIGGVLCWDVNPVYNYTTGPVSAEDFGNVELSVSFADRNDETTEFCQWVCPQPHYLEAWNDAEPKSGMFSLAQPTIPKLFDSRPVQESLLKWSGEQDTNYYTFIKKYWSENLFQQQNEFADERAFWNDALQKGVFNSTENQAEEFAYSDAGLNDALQVNPTSSDSIELQLYQSVALGDGRFANNPWLQELPDPISKISWDNYAAVPVKWAQENGLENGSKIRINALRLPVFIQPGQAEGTISVALGYGRKIAGKVGNNVGDRAYGYVRPENGTRKYWLAENAIEILGEQYPMALSQTHHSMEGRPIVRETSFDAWQLDPGAGNEIRKIHKKHHVSLYPEVEFKGHHWGMAVDLSSCIGCGNCSISCQAENNVPVIGREQVRNRRIMHWIRVDRYFSDDPENPQVLHQPVMCQHCDNAPCENVCPVSATPHSDEGLNQMAYNRCVGTKYCVNNCPYKVRRFNWFQYVNNDAFDFASNSDLGRMVLNPDVTVRSRGVVEKCSFCVQRIQEKKTEAKVAGRKLRDGEIQPACVQSCPADALVFGDLNDPNSKIAKLYKNERNYHLLEELHTLPSVGYLTKVRNKKA